MHLMVHTGSMKRRRTGDLAGGRDMRQLHPSIHRALSRRGTWGELNQWMDLTTMREAFPEYSEVSRGLRENPVFAAIQAIRRTLAQVAGINYAPADAGSREQQVLAAGSAPYTQRRFFGQSDARSNLQTALNARHKQLALVRRLRPDLYEQLANEVAEWGVRTREVDLDSPALRAYPGGAQAALRDAVWLNMDYAVASGGRLLLTASSQNPQAFDNNYWGALSMNPPRDQHRNQVLPPNALRDRLWRRVFGEPVEPLLMWDTIQREMVSQEEWDERYDAYVAVTGQHPPEDYSAPLVDLTSDSEEEPAAAAGSASDVIEISSDDE